MAEGTFALDISRFVKKANGRVELVLQKITLDLLRRVVLKTPVGNPTFWQSPAPPGYVGGRARANWQIAIGGLPYTANDDVDPGGGVTIRTAAAKARQIRGTDTAIYIVNHVPYIVRLENGWSHQAPQGMVKTTLMEYGAVVSKSVTEVKREAS